MRHKRHEFKLVNPISKAQPGTSDEKLPVSFFSNPCLPSAISKLPSFLESARGTITHIQHHAFLPAPPPRVRRLLTQSPPIPRTRAPLIRNKAGSSVWCKRTGHQPHSLTCSCRLRNSKLPRGVLQANPVATGGQILQFPGRVPQGLSRGLVQRERWICRGSHKQTSVAGWLTTTQPDRTKTRPRRLLDRRKGGKHRSLRSGKLCL